MAGCGRSEAIIDAEVVDETPSSALVPLAARTEREPASLRSRPDPSFLTQLIATAEQTESALGLPPLPVPPS